MTQHRCPLCGKLFDEPRVHMHEYGYANTIPVEEDDD